ncbi:hypothetical protein BD560DRAFT_428634 [Blakeslea trispora]|nr:hypothetical protein BD560DRAFT_428634 [Blakeslea trispora]
MLGFDIDTFWDHKKQIGSRNELISMTRAINKHLNRFAVAALENCTALTESFFFVIIFFLDSHLEATCKVMSNTNISLVRKEIQSDEASSSEMEHPCKHEQRQEDTKRRKTQAVKLEGTPSSIEKRFGNL